MYCIFTFGLIRPIFPLMKQRERRDKALDLHDAAISALHRIEALAGLMQAAAGGVDPAPRDIEEATGIIWEETTKVRDALSLMRGLVNSAKAKGNAP